MSTLPEIVTLPSGAKLQLTDPPFEESMGLLKVVASELCKVATDLKIELNFANPAAAMAKLMQQDLPVDVIKNAVLQAIASNAIEGALSQCMGRCLYNGVGVSRASFEPRNARQDYLPAAWEVIKFNLLPFLSGLLSKSVSPGTGTGGTPR